jgi:regulator of sigma E protease
MSTFVAILGLAFLILIHEAGHFYTALAVKMRPRKFYIGFPPPLARVRRRGIEYGIGTIPLGGYVKIPGMHRPAARDLEFRMQPVVRRTPSLVPKVEGVKRLLAAGDYDGARFALEDLATALRQAGEPTDGVTDVRDALSDDAYWRQRPWKKILVIFAGPGTNALFAILVFAMLFMTGGGQATATIDQVVPKTPAAHMALRAGDKIVAINGEALKKASDIPTRISSSHGKPLTLQVRRGDRILILGPTRPEKIEGVYRLGFALKGKGLPPLAAFGHAVKLTGIVSRDIVTSLTHLVHKSGREQISSPVGIVRGSSAAAHEGTDTYLWTLGLISLSLALLNLLPLLPLDGGHILLSLLEAVRGRAIAREVYERFSAVGIALVLLLFFIGLSNDVGRIGGG